MHMADALLSPVVGGGFWIVSGALIGYSAKKITEERDNSKTALMGVLGAFVFAAQMINFTLPGTGSSGHLGGGLLLAVLLGPYRAFITLASVLIIQCLFFADGGLLALGCNVFNLAFFPSFIAFPFLYRVIAGNAPTPGKLAVGSLTAATAALLMGALSVVLETLFSGITELPFGTFVLFMLPVHLAIGVVEGLVTWGVLAFVARTEPGLLVPAKAAVHPRFTFALFAILALFVGGVGSWFASSQPDGLEWSIAKVSGSKEFSPAGGAVHEALEAFQQKVAFLPDYGFKSAPEFLANPESPVDAGSSLSGIVGSLSVLAAAGTVGLLLGRKQKGEKQR
ncbi:energy-coupling factor ABC transporter permease [Pelodictyon phaeoclathratiforme]|jgi:cobalt/nickel transport system permease protein|uniref:Cobalamin (Vitamin B12) biosynthesis CbiM protein n=1 Tax=Pelodictyon phaeoclathratiforme (strain DSM 5477 / BU-1) TaxID=324925 RepID=B4SCY4_PELPB|nr:energy-coupling factor ABC transporter permease [Pelodictyon phaeoclathratiforme]ACF42818.1 cobalamin (vitamin B12) biosynthesis CbiM protein [Pelodictyon phaeoclathratiforme BU-1]MBV5327959.1 energy-coupling factor ABC transporter permease [Chlorobium sp.]